MYLIFIRSGGNSETGRILDFKLIWCCYQVQLRPIRFVECNNFHNSSHQRECFNAEKRITCHFRTRRVGLQDERASNRNRRSWRCFLPRAIKVIQSNCLLFFILYSKGVNRLSRLASTLIRTESLLTIVQNRQKIWPSNDLLQEV